MSCAAGRARGWALRTRNSLAGLDVDLDVVAGLQLHAVVLGHHAREELAVGAHERCQERGFGVDAELREDRHPGVDAGADGVDEGAVEVEDDGVRGARGVVIETESECMALAYDAGAFSSWRASSAGSVVGRSQAKSRQR